jgi:hypothetical protein
VEERILLIVEVVVVVVTVVVVVVGGGGDGVYVSRWVVGRLKKREAEELMLDKGDVLFGYEKNET